MLIFIDLDDTILDFKKCESEALNQTLRFFGITPTSENVEFYSKINDKMWKKLERKELTRSEILVLRFKEFLEALNIDNLDPNSLNEAYKSNLSKTAFFIDGATDLLQSLYKKHRLFIVSNGTVSVQESRIEKAGIEKYFEKIFLSEDVGFDKPDVRFFEKCFECVNDFSKEDSIILGDSITSDIQGGINAGIKTCLFNPLKKSVTVKPDYEISSLAKFLEIL